MAADALHARTDCLFSSIDNLVEQHLLPVDDANRLYIEPFIQSNHTPTVLGGSTPVVKT